MTCDTWHVTCDMQHMTHVIWHVTLHVTCDMLWVLSVLSKFQLPSSYGLGSMIFFWFGGKGWLTHWMNELLTKVFVEQPRIHHVSKKVRTKTMLFGEKMKKTIMFRIKTVSLISLFSENEYAVLLSSFLGIWFLWWSVQGGSIFQPAPWMNWSFLWDLSILCRVFGCQS